MSRYNDHERVLSDLMKDPNASSDARAKAALAVDRMKQRRALAKRKKQEVEAKPLLDAVLSPEPLSPEVLAELERRGLDGPPEQPCAYCGDKSAWYVRDDKVYCWRHRPAMP